MDTNSPLPDARMKWAAFFAVLIAPPVLTILAVQFRATSAELAPGIALLGGGASGIVCGAMLGRRVGSTTGLRIVLGCVFALMMIAVCVGMSCFGCLVGGFKMDFR